MKKILLLTFFLAIITFCVKAQLPSTSGQLSIGFEYGDPVGGASSTYWIGIGASLKYEKPVNSDVSVNLSVGYTDLNYTKALKDYIRTFGSNHSGDNFVPVKVGVKHFFDPDDPHFFAEGQIGSAIPTEKGANAAFIFAPGAGYKFESGFEAGLRYEGWFKGDGNVSQIAIRLAYNF